MMKKESLILIKCLAQCTHTVETDHPGIKGNLISFLCGEQAWTPMFCLKSRDMDSTQVGEAVLGHKWSFLEFRAQFLYLSEVMFVPLNYKLLLVHLFHQSGYQYKSLMHYSKFKEVDCEWFCNLCADLWWLFRDSFDLSIFRHM